jgi:putative transposase
MRIDPRQPISSVKKKRQQLPAVADQAYASETAHHASALIRRACLREHIVGRQLVLYANNCSAMKGAIMLATLHEIGVA